MAAAAGTRPAVAVERARRQAEEAWAAEAKMWGAAVAETAGLYAEAVAVAAARAMAAAGAERPGARPAVRARAKGAARASGATRGWDAVLGQWPALAGPQWSVAAAT
jgi:hypothetical protein